jgi:phage shock protein PspC (stress-responsive transcriptional regulator)
MNKTVIININGIIFHIEEDAYEKLSKYLNTIKGYFRDSDGRDEIMSDIEARIAELFQEKVNTIKQVVILSDVDEVIAKMGKPEEYAADSESNNSTSQAGPTNSASGFSSENGNYKRRRVFRDPDDKVLGGVCSGIANHFDFDPIYLRGAFAILFFVFGSGFLLYILLWIIIPKAVTTAEKLEMRGEPINVDNIKRSVEEELNDVKGRVNDLGEKVKSPENKARVSSATDRVLNFIGSILRSIFKVALKFFSVFFLIFGIVLLALLTSSLFGFTNLIHNDMHDTQIAYSIADFLHAFFGSEFLVNTATLGLLFFVGIPLIMLIYSCIKILFSIKTRNRIVRITAFSLWLSGLLMLIYVGVQIGDDFKEEAKYEDRYEIKSPTSQVMYLNLIKDSKYNFNEKYGYQSRVRINHWNLVKVNKNGISFGYPEVDVEKSETDSFKLLVIKGAQGSTNKEATIRARSISYTFTQHDSILDFNPYFDITKEDKWRDQSVRIVLQVPVGKVIYLNKNMKNIIYDIDNVSNTWDDDMAGRRWVMTRDGLECLDCDGLEKRNSENSSRSGRKHIRINKDGVDIDIDTDDSDWDDSTEIVPPVPPAPPVEKDVRIKIRKA